MRTGNHGLRVGEKEVMDGSLYQLRVMERKACSRGSVS